MAQQIIIRTIEDLVESLEELDHEKQLTALFFIAFEHPYVTARPETAQFAMWAHGITHERFVSDFCEL